jgi:hypothetical protein
VLFPWNDNALSSVVPGSPAGSGPKTEASEVLVETGHAKKC